MPNEYSALFDQDAQQQQATGNIAATAGVQPEHALTGLDGQPLTGIPASVGMHSPDLMAQQAQTQTQQATIAASPPVAQWAATAEPAHLAVTKDDFPNLAAVASKVGDYLKYVNGNPIEDLTNAFKSQAADLSANTQLAANPSNPLLSRVVGAGKAALDLLPGFIVAPVTEPIARAYAPFITQTNPILPWEAPRPLTTPEEKLNEARNIVNLAFLAQSHKVGAPVEEGATTAPKPGPNAGVIGEPFTPPAPSDLRTAQATADAQHVAAMQEAVADTKTHSRSVDVAESYLAQQTGDATVAVDPDKLVELAQNGKQPFEDHAQDIIDGAADGTPVEVPLSKYVARTAGQPYADELNAATNFRPDGVSVDEAKEVQDTEPAAEQASVAVPPDLTPEEAPRYQNLAAASNSSVDRIVAAQQLRQLFTDPKAIGMTEPQFNAYNEGIENHIADVKDKLLDRAYQSVLAERKPEFQASVAQHSAAVEQELAANPAIQARNYLALGKGPLGEPVEAPFKLDREDAIAKYGKDLGLPDRMFGKNGVSADEAAEVFGYPSGADMVRDLSALHEAQGDMTIVQHMKSMVKALATDRARGELGFDLSPEGIESAAQELVNGPKVGDFLADELQTLAKTAGLPFDRNALQSYADDRFANTVTKRALNLKSYIKSTHMLGVKAEKALLKGDVPLAFIRKQQQFIQQRQLAASLKFAKKAAQSEKLFARVQKSVSIKGVSQDALNWSKDILATTGRAVKGNPVDLQRPIGGFNTLEDYVAAKANEGSDTQVVPVQRTALSAQTVQQFRDVSDMVRSIMTWGKKENEVVLRGKAVALDQALNEGITSLSRYSRNISETELRHPTMLQAIDSARRNVDAWLVRTEQLLRDFGDKDFNSPFFQVVTRGLQDGRAYSMDTRLAMAKHFHGVSKDIGGGFDKWLKAKLPANGPHDVVTDVDGGNLFITNRDVMVAALHMGDQGALDAFTKGYKTDEPTVSAIVHANATPEMWKTVRGIWDAFDKLRPDIVSRYRGRTGVTPELVEPRSFAMPDGSVNPGGYFPISRDPAKLPKNWIAQDNSMLGSPHYTRVTPSNNYLTQRTGSITPVNMSLDAIYTRLNQTIHDLAYRDALASANKFLLHPKMQETITRKYGPEYVNRLKTYLQDIAGAESVNPIDSRIGRALDFMSERQQISMIGFSPSTMMKHGFTAQFQGMQQVGVPRYLAAVARTRLQPGKYLKAAMSESADVRHILSTYNEDAYRQFLRNTTGKFSITRAGLSTAFHLVGMSNRLVAVPLYDAAKLMLRETKPELAEPTIQAAAGQMVRQALGSSGVTESPAIMMQSKGFAGKALRMTNPFMTFLNHMYNISREIPQNLGYAGQKVNFGYALSLMLTAQVLPIFIDQAIARKTVKFGKDVSSTLAAWAEGLIHQNTSAVPVLNSGVAAAIGAMDKSQPGGDNLITEAGSDIGSTLINSFNAEFHHRQMTQSKIHTAIRAAGYVSPVPFPSLQAVRLEEFFHKMSQGKESDWQTVLHDLTLGADPKTAK